MERESQVYQDPERIELLNTVSAVADPPVKPGDLIDPQTMVGNNPEGG